MALRTISIEVEVRDDREEEAVKNVLTKLMALNGATGILNLWDELTKSQFLMNQVQKIVAKFRRSS